jgi:histidinol dehydrogenase
MPLRLDATAPDFEQQFSGLLAQKRDSDADVNDVVTAILQDVQARGDQALFDLTRKFDRFQLTGQTLRFTTEEINSARRACDADTLAALEVAAARIIDFHARQKPDDLDYTDAQGLRLGYKWTAVENAGLYVPGGTAAYPSSVLMNAIPANVAGVERLVMVVPTPDGVINPLVLAAAEISGVHEIYRIGGAQAVAALAYGTQSIKPVDKISGPGNAYVAAAKRLVFGTVGIDMIAGPSEILILADASCDPAWIAADLLSQAEHDAAAQSILITDDDAFAGQVIEAVESHLRTLPRAETARKSWQTHGAVIAVPALDDAIALIDRIAPEHLEIVCDRARELGQRVRNAGAIFMGHYVPEALGDYLAGPNHVLPTARSARFSSGLGVLDFMKRTSMIECSADGLRAVGPDVVTLAKAEGLDAHGLSVSIRMNLPK